MIIAGNGGDTIGGDGNDLADGGTENDAAFGGAGNDVLAGNFNADLFVFADFGSGFGRDTITDFAATNDFEKIELGRVVSIGNLFDLFSNHIDQVGANVVIDAGGGHTITLNGVGMVDLGRDEFFLNSAVGLHVNVVTQTRRIGAVPLNFGKGRIKCPASPEPHRPTFSPSWACIRGISTRAWMGLIPLMPPH